MDHKESDLTEWLTVEVNSSLLATPVHLKQIDDLLFLYFFFKVLFRINKESQFRVCNHGEPHASSLQQGERDGFKEEEGKKIIKRRKEVGRV